MYIYTEQVINTYTSNEELLYYGFKMFNSMTIFLIFYFYSDISMDAESAARSQFGIFLFIVIFLIILDIISILIIRSLKSKKKNPLGSD